MLDRVLTLDTLACRRQRCRVLERLDRGDGDLDLALADGRPDDAVEVRRLCARASARLLGRSEPMRIGRYEVLRPLGAGSSGVVYEAFDPQLRRSVALKVLRMAASDTAGVERIRREATTLGRLHDPELLTVFDVGVHAEGGTTRPYLVTALAPGRDLVTWARGRPAAVRVTDLVVVAAAAARAVGRAHRAGVVHRDLKPEHILVGDRREITIIDFGLSSVSGPGSSIGGTPAYAAPELLQRAAPHRGSDQYALCVAVWEAAALPTRGSALARDLESVLRRGLAPNPGDRWPSMGALADALGRCGSRRRRQRRTKLAVGMALAGIAVWLARPATTESTPIPTEVETVHPTGDLEQQRLRAEVLAHFSEGRRDRALAVAQRAYDAATQTDSSERNRTALLLGHMARENGELERAQAVFSALYFRAADGRSDEQLGIALEAAAAMVFLYGQGFDLGDTADQWVEHGRAILDRLEGHEGNDAGYFHNAAGVLRAAQFRNDDAIAHYDEAIAIFERNPEMAEAEAAARANLGLVLARITQEEAGAEQLRRALELRLERHGPDAFVVGETLLNLGSVVQLYDPAAALEYLQRGGKIMARYDGPGQRTRVVVMETNIGKCLLALGRTEEAVEHLRVALAESETTSDPGLLAVDARIALADGLLELGESARARDHLLEARNAIDDEDDPRFRAATARLAQTVTSPGAG